METLYSTINILDSLKSKYNEFLKKGITLVSIIQFEHSVCLEFIETEVAAGGLEKQTVRRLNLDSRNYEEDGIYFDSKDPIETNAIKFIDEFSPYSIAAIGLFHEEACKKILDIRQAAGI